MRTILISLLSSAALTTMLTPPSGAAAPPGARLASPTPHDEPRGVREFHVYDESTISRALRFADTGDRTLDVRAIHGSIRVIGADRPDVQLDVLRRVRADTDADLDAADDDVVLDLVDGQPAIEAIVRERDGDVCGDETRHSRGTWRRPPYVVTYDFAIQVPRDTRLRLCTIDGREVLVEGTSGAFDLTNVNGRITMPNMRGSGVARTVNGAIVAAFGEQPHQASSFITTNGDVIVGFPADLDADLRMKTFNGGLFTDFEVQALPQPVPTAERRNDGVVYRVNQFTLVRAGRGGPELTFETFNGSVRVVRTAR